MSEKEFTYKNLARLFQAIDTSDLSVVRQDLLLLVEREPFAAMYRYLEQLAETAGLDRHWNGWELHGVRMHETFDLLFQTESWDDPRVLDARKEGALNLAALLNICRARKIADLADLPRLLEMEHKLVAAAEKERELQSSDKWLGVELYRTLLQLIRTLVDQGRETELLKMLGIFTAKLAELETGTPAAISGGPAAIELEAGGDQP